MTIPGLLARHRRWRADLSVYVVELDDAVGPRRSERPDRPNLFVGLTSQDPVARMDQIRRGRGPPWVRDHAVRLRPDLFANYLPTTRTDADRQKRKLVGKLNRRGFTVNRNTEVWTEELTDG